MEDFSICKKCGAKTEFRIEGRSQGIFCKNCNWSLVTTYMAEIERDETIYSVYTIEANYQNAEQIKAVSSVSGMNYLDARKLLQQIKPLIFEGKAINIIKVKDILDSAGLKYEIIPEFRY